MPFQALLDPFGYALQAEGQRLQNDARSLDNETKLYDVKLKRLQFDAVMGGLAKSSLGADQMGGMPTPKGLQNATGDTQEPTRADGTPIQAPNSVELFKKAKAIQDEADSPFIKFNIPQRTEVMKRAETAFQAAAQAQEREHKDRQAAFSDIANAMAAAAESPLALGQQWAMLKQKLPPWFNLDQLAFGDPSKGQGFGLQRGPNGIPVYDKTLLETAGASSEVAREKDRLLQEKIRNKLADERAAREQQAREDAHKATARLEKRQQEHDTEKAEEEKYGKLERGKRWIDPKHKELGQEPIPIKFDPKIAKQAQEDLLKDPLTKNYDKYKQAKGTADSILRTIATQGWDRVTAPQLQQLRAHYQNIIEDYRGRMGGKFNQQEFDKLNGAFQHLDNWISTVGGPTSAIAQSGARDVLNVINDEFYTRTRQLVEKELKTVKMVEREHGDSGQLVLNGDLKALLNGKYPNGMRRATIQPDTEDKTKKWIFLINPDGSTSDPYPYPQGNY